MATSLSVSNCNIIMTGELMHTASKERMVPELVLLSECVPQLSEVDVD